MNNLIGQHIDRFQIVSQLGEGGMATVFQAHDTRLERSVAIKVIRADHRRSADFLARFEREAKALAKLTHPNIVHVNDFGDHEGTPYLVMDYLPGGNLKQKFTARQAPMCYRAAASLIKPIAAALAYAHEKKVIHRDVKPANILFAGSGQPMLTDFGLAKMLEPNDDTTLTVSGFSIGTPDYMAPEQWLGEAVPQTDIYALGVVFFELITGQRPYTADHPAAILLRQANEPAPKPSDIVPDLPGQVDRVLLKTLEKSPEQRYPTMFAFRTALEELDRIDPAVEMHNVQAAPAGMEKHGEPKPGKGGRNQRQPPAGMAETHVVDRSQGRQPTVMEAARAPSGAARIKRRALWVFGFVLLTFILWGAVGSFLDQRKESVPANPQERPFFTQYQDIPKRGFENPPAATWLVLEESFDNPVFDGHFNENRWQTRRGNDRQMYQDMGSLHFNLPPSKDGEIAISAVNTWRVMDLNWISTRMKVDSYQGTGFASTDLTLYTQQEGVSIQCHINSIDPFFSCVTQNKVGDTIVFVAAKPLDFGVWVDILIAIDPRTFTLNVYVDEQWAGAYTPQDAKDWVQSPLRISLGVHAQDTSAAFSASFDKLLLGSQFEKKTEPAPN